jgi:5-methylcytosine-specific restriction endonuclease McrA
MARKKGYCRKCGQFLPIDDHHILPLQFFPNSKETEKLCPNCHNLMHDQLNDKLKVTKNPTMEFFFENYYKWLAGLVIIGILALIFI